MITESPKKSVDEVHESPSHPSGMGPALPGFHARCLSPARAAAATSFTVWDWLASHSAAAHLPRAARQMV